MQICLFPREVAVQDQKLQYPQNTSVWGCTPACSSAAQWLMGLCIAFSMEELQRVSMLDTCATDTGYQAKQLEAGIAPGHWCEPDLGSTFGPGEKKNPSGVSVLACHCPQGHYTTKGCTSADARTPSLLKPGAAILSWHHGEASSNHQQQQTTATAESTKATHNRKYRSTVEDSHSDTNLLLVLFST